MKTKKLIRVAIGIVATIILLPGLCAARSRTSFGINVSYGDDRDYHRSHYKNYRYFPNDYYHHKKVYFLPERRNYYYYDVYPDKAYYYETEKTVVPDNPAYISITSIANMGSQGIPDGVIIEEITRTRSVYHLTSEVINYLKQNNVSDRVINAMLETARE